MSALIDWLLYMLMIYLFIGSIVNYNSLRQLLCFFLGALGSVLAGIIIFNLLNIFWSYMTTLDKFTTTSMGMIFVLIALWFLADIIWVPKNMVPQPAIKTRKIISCAMLGSAIVLFIILPPLGAIMMNLVSKR